jgi:hypothetical protein
LIRLKLEVSIVVGEVVGQLVYQVSTNLKLLIELVNLLNSFLVGSQCPIDLTELRTEITENVRKDGDSKHNDK